jgi:hypothetical protein
MEARHRVYAEPLERVVGVVFPVLGLSASRRLWQTPNTGLLMHLLMKINHSEFRKTLERVS